MDYIVVEGVKPYDGRYEFDLDRDFTTREWGWIKRLSGYMPLTVGPGLDGRDPELYAVFATIAMVRAEKIEKREVPEVFERLSDAPFGASVSVESDTPAEEQEVEDRPPERSSNGSPVSSGLVSPTSSGTSEPSLPPSGIPSSDSSPSVPTTSGT